MQTSIRMDYIEFRTMVWYVKQNLNVNFSYAQSNDNTPIKYYEIHAVEPAGGQGYWVKINSQDDSDFVDDFEQNWMEKCNHRTERLGMNPDEIRQMLINQDLMLMELQMANKLLEVLAGAKISYADIRFDKDYHV